MDILSLLIKLKEKVNTSQDAKKYALISSIIDSAINQCEDNKFCSISDAARVFLEISSDYKSDIYQEICSVDTTISTVYKEALIHFFKETSALSEKRIEKCIKELKIHNDLYKELIEYILNGKKYTGIQLIEVQGYNAKTLVEKYPLTVVGAYNYLMYLREDPINAKNDLSKGLPQK